eukprot:gnl/Dysnectes_brevis/4706_a6448_603.p1 GENE.gnl/Dysnectes_brevis/4706_a6448_603~~gnl/Dysnectes_brevis/4706_a6448_603.p1  ORF type:complete len:400 (+),score=40.53 gnl/Dysnectes_brevis/4706_a6448_603:70-1269(+)
MAKRKGFPHKRGRRQRSKRQGSKDQLKIMTTGRETTYVVKHDYNVDEPPRHLRRTRSSKQIGKSGSSSDLNANTRGKKRITCRGVTCVILWSLFVLLILLTILVVLVSSRCRAPIYIIEGYQNQLELGAPSDFSKYSFSVDIEFGSFTLVVDDSIDQMVLQRGWGASSSQTYKSMKVDVENDDREKTLTITGFKDFGFLGRIIDCPIYDLTLRIPPTGSLALTDLDINIDIGSVYLTTNQTVSLGAITINAGSYTRITSERLLASSLSIEAPKSWSPLVVNACSLGALDVDAGRGEVVVWNNGFSSGDVYLNRRGLLLAGFSSLVTPRLQIEAVIRQARSATITWIDADQLCVLALDSDHQKSCSFDTWQDHQVATVRSMGYDMTVVMMEVLDDYENYL